MQHANVAVRLDQDPLGQQKHPVQVLFYDDSGQNNAYSKM